LWLFWRVRWTKQMVQNEIVMVWQLHSSGVAALTFSLWFEFHICSRPWECWFQLLPPFRMPFHPSSMDPTSSHCDDVRLEESSWCFPPAQSLGWCQLSFPAVWLWGPWYSLWHCSQWPKHQKRFFFYSWQQTIGIGDGLTVPLHCVPFQRDISDTCYDDRREFGKGPHGCISLHPSRRPLRRDFRWFRLNSVCMVSNRSGSLSRRLFWR